MARPSTYDEVKAQAFHKHIESGNTRRCAAALAGLSPRAVREWIRKGRAGQAPYAAFVARLSRADAVAESLMVRRLIEIAKEDPRQALGAVTFWLSQRRWKEWGRKRDLKPDSESVEASMTDEELLDAIAKDDVLGKRLTKIA